MHRLPIAAIVALIAFVGCGEQGGSTPVACLEGELAYLDALDAAPGVVELDETTLISECLTESQGGGDLAEVGTAMLSAATNLNAEARAKPGGEANVQLGYLLGAAQRGADETEGIHDELVRRLAAAARYSPENRPLPPAFRRAYRQGFDAGLERG
ncbi:MAG TPA: hypothetical protein VFT19_02865 [Solirubrobacterales bacterium]|nr:hypothetical protein [Solirubrobacterales bacterium]